MILARSFGCLSKASKGAREVIAMRWHGLLMADSQSDRRTVGKSALDWISPASRCQKQSIAGVGFGACSIYRRRLAVVGIGRRHQGSLARATRDGHHERIGAEQRAESVPQREGRKFQRDQRLHCQARREARGR